MLLQRNGAGVVDARAGAAWRAVRSMCGCVSKRPRPYNTSSPLVLLQISPDDEHAVPLRSRRQFLQAADTRELLRTPAFRKHDVDLETVADLFVLVQMR